MPRFTRHSRFARMLCASFCLLLASGPWVAASAQSRQAVIAGAEMVFVRRGPGMNFPPFARLNKDSVVTIKGHQGEWVQVETASAQVGFVHGKYLTPLDREEAAALAPPLAAAGTAATTAETGDRAATPEATEATAERAADRLAPWPPEIDPKDEIVPDLAVAAPSDPFLRPERRTSMAEERAAIAEEIRLLTAAVANLERRIADNEPIDDGFGSADRESDGGSVLGGAVLLGLLCTGIGWYLGSRYSRAQERGRQARIRF